MTNKYTAKVENRRGLKEQKVSKSAKGIRSKRLKKTRNDHMLLKGKVSYTCGRCKTNFKYKGLLDNHIKTIHNDGGKKCKCRFCDVKIKVGYNYRRHLFRFHSHEKDQEVQNIIKPFASSKWK